jgi:hypothetical protein
MQYQGYTEIFSTKNLMTFKFFSNGSKGGIWKVVQFSPVRRRAYCNLAFGDLQADGTVDGRQLTDNGDRNKVIATVAYVLSLFLDHHARTRVIFQGSTPVHTRWYRMFIHQLLPGLPHEYSVEGLQRGKDGAMFLQPFTAGMDYEAFVVKKKGWAEYSKPPPSS